jgi:hypothetical protein
VILKRRNLEVDREELHIALGQKEKWKCTILIAAKRQINAFARQDADGNVNIMKSRGLGDSIEKFTKATGIKKVVEALPGDCGCNKRREALNKVFPYKK